MSQVDDIIARWNGMKTARMNWDVLWDQCARYISPRKGNILTKNTPGQEQTNRIYDTTAEEALGIGAAGLVTHIVPAGERWLRLEPKARNSSPALASWLDEVGERVLQVFYESNFYETIHEDFLDALDFGTSCLLVDMDPEAVANFVNVPVGTFAIAENDRGQVDTVAREWKWSARQAEQKWGRDALGDNVRKALESNNASDWSREFRFVHFVEPRKNGYRGGPVAGPMRPIASYYICVEDMKMVDEDGYYSMPYCTSRLLRSNNEIYGRGPGVQTLPRIKMVNGLVRDYIAAVEKLVNPPWLMGEDSAFRLDNRANSQNYWDTTNPAGKPEQVQLKNNVQWCKDMIDEERQAIRRAFYNDMFQMLTNIEEVKREKTAYEVQQMVAEKLVLFSPMFGRITREKLNPAVARVLDLMIRASEPFWRNGQEGVLPVPPPEAQAGAGYNIVYVSKIALAIKAAENQSFATMMTLIEQAAALDPSIANLIKWNDGVRRVAHNVGLPPSLLRTDREAAKITADQQAAQQAAQSAQTGELATRAVKNLGPQAQTQVAQKIIGGAGKAA